MAAGNPALMGQADGAGDDRALFYKKFTGEVLSAYMTKNIMEGRHRVRNIRGQKSAGFANTGKASGRIHTPGSEITGQPALHNETVITVDDLIISDRFIADIHEAMNHYDVRRDYSRQMGQAIGRTFDKQVLRVGFQAARSSNKITGLPGGTTLTLSGNFGGTNTAEQDAQEFAEACFAAHQQIVENDGDPDDAFVIMTPARYFALTQFKDLLNRDWGGAGSYADASLPRIGGLPVLWTNNMPTQDDAANITSPGGGDIDYVTDGLDVISTAYADDYSKVEALVMTPQAVGTVKLIDIALETDRDVRRQGDLMVAKMACGHGVLRPEDAVEIVRP